MSALNSRHLCHLPWVRAAVAPHSRTQIVLVCGTTGMMAPKHEFVELAYYDDEYHPRAEDHWFDMNNDHLTDRGFKVTHWCPL
jgi:hypothetical protein